jgi:hypothetical protein
MRTGTPLVRSGIWVLHGETPLRAAGFLRIHGDNGRARDAGRICAAPLTPTATERA